MITTNNPPNSQQAPEEVTVFKRFLPANAAFSLPAASALNGRCRSVLLDFCSHPCAYPSKHKIARHGMAVVWSGRSMFGMGLKVGARRRHQCHLIMEVPI